MAQGSLGTRGVYIGQDLYGAGGFCYNAWETLTAGDHEPEHARGRAARQR